MSTATIPFLSRSHHRTSPDGSSVEVLTASEEELAQLSESTLAQLRERVRRVASGPTQIDEQAELSTATTLAHSDANIDSATQELVNIVLERSNPSVPVVLLFVGSEPNHHVDEVTARVAAALCDHTVSRVLLVDSDNVHKNLTQAAHQSPGLGVTEVIEYNKDWRSSLVRNEASNLDFIPAGNGSFGRWNEKTLLRKAVCEMKSEYQFVCVAGGDAHGKAATLWSDVCDGSYLIVSIKNSNGTVAKSAVAELKSNGARLLGCVVTDVGDA